jgi:hypothetical protein
MLPNNYCNHNHFIFTLGMPHQLEKPSKKILFVQFCCHKSSGTFKKFSKMLLPMLANKIIDISPRSLFPSRRQIFPPAPFGST